MIINEHSVKQITRVKWKDYLHLQKTSYYRTKNNSKKKYAIKILPVCQTMVDCHSRLWSQQWMNKHLPVRVHLDQLPSLSLIQISHRLLHDQTPGKNYDMRCNSTYILWQCNWNGSNIILLQFLYIYVHSLQTFKAIILKESQS